MADTTKMLLLAGAGAAVAAGAIYLTTRKRTERRAAATGPSPTIPGLSFASSPTASQGSVAGSVTQGTAYVLLLHSAPPSALGTDWRNELSAALTALGWQVHTTATGQPAVSNDAIDSGLTDTNGYTVIATWPGASGSISNSLASVPVTYDQIVPTTQLTK